MSETQFQFFLSIYAVSDKISATGLTQRRLDSRPKARDSRK